MEGQADADTRPLMIFFRLKEKPRGRNDDARIEKGVRFRVAYTERGRGEIAKGGGGGQREGTTNPEATE